MVDISHCYELVPSEFELTSLSEVCVKSSASFAFFIPPGEEGGVEEKGI